MSFQTFFDFPSETLAAPSKVARVGKAMAAACEACGMAPGSENVAAFLEALKHDPKFTAPSAQALVAK
jgi:uncharacterized protein (DUF885 family)